MATATVPDPPAALAPLRNPVFRAIWLSAQFSSLGWLIQTVAMGWLMATIATSDLMVALVQASSSLPAFVLSVFSGALADNFSRRAVMIVGRCVLTAAFAVLTLLLALGIVDPWLILALSFLAGCGGALIDPAWQASVGDIVERRDIPAAVTLISVGFNTVRSVGPALGGVIVAAFGPLAAFTLSCACYVVPIGVLLRLRWNVQASTLPRESMATAIHDGIRFTAMSSAIKSAIARGALFGLAGISTLALLPLTVRDALQGGPVAYGTLMAAFGLGAFAGGMSNTSLRRVLSQETLVALACLASALCALTLSLTRSVPVAAVALAFGGAGWVTAWSGIGVSVQMASPRWIVGRTIAIYYALTAGGVAGGSWLWGMVAQNVSLQAAMACSGSAMLVVAVLGRLIPIRESQETAAPVAEDVPTPAIALDLKPRSGPVVVRIDYQVAEADLPNFLALMRARRRAHASIGARHWTLQRDLLVPAHWTESFRTPTWTDYLRLNGRLTQADRALNERILALHAGPSPPALTLAIERPTGLARKADQAGAEGALLPQR